MRYTFFPLILVFVSWSAHAACPEAPVASPNELAIQLKKQPDGTAAWAATNQISATVEGALVWDDANNNIAYCDGINWVSPSTEIATDNLGNHIAEQNIVLGQFFLSADGNDQGLILGEDGRLYINTQGSGSIVTAPLGPPA